MKHPKDRVADILYTDPTWRDEVFNYVRGVRNLLPPFIKNNMVDIQLCGSRAFGNSNLYSDWDFNIAMGDWNDQFKARRIYYGNLGRFRGGIEDYLMDFRRRYDVKIDLGCVDCDTEKYNIHVSLRDMVLHHRFSLYPEEFRADENGIVWETTDVRPIDLRTFNTNENIPMVNQHLRWNFMIHRWQRIMLDGQPSTIVPYLNAKRGGFAEDRFLSEVPEWQNKYGSRFLTYHREGERLIPD